MLSRATRIEHEHTASMRSAPRLRQVAHLRARRRSFPYTTSGATALRARHANDFPRFRQILVLTVEPRHCAPSRGFVGSAHGVHTSDAQELSIYGAQQAVRIALSREDRGERSVSGSSSPPGYRSGPPAPPISSGSPGSTAEFRVLREVRPSCRGSAPPESAGKEQGQADA